MPKIITLKEAKQIFVNRNLIPLFDEYNHCMEKLLTQTLEGYLVKTNLTSVKNNIMPYIFHKSNPYTIQNLKLWCKLNNKSFELLDGQEYLGVFNKLKWKCLKEECGEIFEADWGCIQRNYGCPYCAGVKVGLSNCLATKYPELISEWHPTKNSDLTPYNVTCGSNKNIWWICDKGHEWEAMISNRVKDNHCPYCSHTLPSEDYNLLIFNPKLCEEWDYNKNDKKPEEYTPNSGKKVWWKCKECGYEWKTSISKRNHGTGCPECNKSKGEKRIKEWLDINNIIYDIEYGNFFDLLSDMGNSLRFDFAIFNDLEKTQLNMLIEYDGKQHYEWVKGFYTKQDFIRIQYHDQLKNEYCKKHNIKLIRIPYWDFDNIEEILEKELRLA